MIWKLLLLHVVAVLVVVFLRFAMRPDYIRRIHEARRRFMFGFFAAKDFDSYSKKYGCQMAMVGLGALVAYLAALFNILSGNL